MSHSHEEQLFLAATGVRLDDWTTGRVRLSIQVPVIDIELRFPTRSRWAKEIELSRRLAASLPHDYGPHIAFIGEGR
jgi:hypothetical protein